MIMAEPQYLLPGVTQHQVNALAHAELETKG
jgi:hypothetical protein